MLLMFVAEHGMTRQMAYCKKIRHVQQWKMTNELFWGVTDAKLEVISAICY